MRPSKRAKRLVVTTGGRYRKLRTYVHTVSEKFPSIQQSVAHFCLSIRDPYCVHVFHANINSKKGHVCTSLHIQAPL